MKVKVKKQNKPTKSDTYVVHTDKGYLIGDNLVGVTFTDKKTEARQFDFDEACAYKTSIAADLFDFYGCKSMEFETLPEVAR